MRWSKVLGVMLILFLVVGTGLAYTGSGDSGSVDATACNNDADDDNDDLKDGEDPGCTEPLYEDDFEGNIWDSDLTATMHVYLDDGNEGEAPELKEAESVFFDGTVFQSSDLQDGTDYPDQSTDSSITEYYIDTVASEGDEDKYAGGRQKKKEYTNFPSGTIFVSDSDRVIDPPNPDGSVTCGDGIENEGVGCLPDYGDRSKDEAKDGSSQTTDCQDDDGVKTSSPTCTGDSLSGNKCGGYSCTSGSASVDDDNSDDIGKTYWRSNGDQRIYEWECQRDGVKKEDSTDSVSCQDCSTGTKCTNEEPKYCNSPIGKYQCGTKCTSSTATCTSCSSKSCGGGKSATAYYRAFKKTNNYYDCNKHNANYGGGDSEKAVNKDYSGSDEKADNDQAGTFVDHEAGQKNKAGTDYCVFEKDLTVDADGPRGYGDGFVVIKGGSIAATMAPNGKDVVGQRVMVNGNEGSMRDYRDKISASCNGNNRVCLKYVDYYTRKGSGPPGSPEWTSVSGAVKMDQEGLSPSESYSVCKLINRINEKNGDGSELIECDREVEGGGGGGSPGDDGPTTGTCRDQDDEYWIAMEGPEVDNSAVSQESSHFARCTTSKNDCNLRGKAVSEGTVADVSSDKTPEYERGGASPDMEVCLNIGDGSGEFTDVDNVNDGNKDGGGEWYDLDSDTAQDYLRSNGVPSGGSGENSASYYYHSSTNPPHSDRYNPEGGQEGLSMEDDCGNSRFNDGINCDESAGNSDTKPRQHSENTFYTFFGKHNGGKEGMREEDYHPQGKDSGENTLAGFTGVANKLQDESDQMEPGNGLDTYSNFPKWSDSRNGDYADDWAISKTLEWSVSSRGIPYPPFGTYYRNAYTGKQRSSPDDGTVDKTAKVFGNSYAAVDGNKGTWIDPDSFKTTGLQLTSGSSGWRAAMEEHGFKIDLTGPDSGIGIKGSPRDHFGDDNEVFIGEIYFEPQESGSDNLEKPMCGDDKKEYFIEEIGESINPARYSGKYACSDSLNSCYDSDASAGERVVGFDEYRNTDEPGEGESRTKKDKEVCQKTSQDAFAIWYDQDYNSSMCRVNTLYGPNGRRWIEPSYVKKHPEAVTGGIDDDWNDYIDDRRKGLSSRPDKESWDFSTETPVDTGTTGKKVATKGFCTGDDGSEYLVTQKCNTNLCQSDTSIIGAARNPNYCVLDGSNLPVSGEAEERSLYAPGQSVELNVEGGTPITCFKGTWYEKWPVSFDRGSAEVPSSTERKIGFSIVNVRSSPVKFKVELPSGTQQPHVSQFVRKFGPTKGDSFTTTVPGQSSKQYHVTVYGADASIDDTVSAGGRLKIQASAVNSPGYSGEDQVMVDILPRGEKADSGQTKNVPGIGPLHLIFILLASTLVFFGQS